MVADAIEATLSLIILMGGAVVVTGMLFGMAYLISKKLSEEE